MPYAGLLRRPGGATPVGPAVVAADPTTDLPFARQEGRAVAERWPGSVLLAGADARRSVVLAALDQARLFHFAGHGVLRPDSPWDAHLRLHRGERLTLSDVLVARARVGLVVLSGCETGHACALGRERVGLPEAFLAAGARAVLASDETLDDAAARRFLDRFFGAGGGDHAADPLRTALAESIAAGEGAVGAAFRLTGG